MMNAKEFLTAVDNIVKEKGIDKEIVFEAMETALTTAFKKNYGKSNSKVGEVWIRFFAFYMSS